MSVYAIHVSGNSAAIKESIEKSFTLGSFYGVDEQLWFVDSPFVTTREVSQLIAPNNDKGRFLVLPVVSYYGYHDKAVWEWLSAKGV